MTDCVVKSQLSEIQNLRIHILEMFASIEAIAIVSELQRDSLFPNSCHLTDRLLYEYYV